jgi:hypothetical protein
MFCIVTPPLRTTGLIVFRNCLVTPPSVYDLPFGVHGFQYLRLLLCFICSIHLPNSCGVRGEASHMDIELPRVNRT